MMSLFGSGPVSEPASISMARGGTPRTPLPSSAACLAVLPLVVRAAALVSLIGGCSRRCVHAAAHIETGLVSVPVIAHSFTKTGLRVFSFTEAAIFQRGGSMSLDGDGTSRCDASDASHVGSPLMPDVPSPLSRQLHCPGEFFPPPPRSLHARLPAEAPTIFSRWRCSLVAVSYLDYRAAFGFW